MDAALLSAPPSLSVGLRAASAAFSQTGSLRAVSSPSATSAVDFVLAAARRSHTDARAFAESLARASDASPALIKALVDELAATTASAPHAATAAAAELASLKSMDWTLLVPVASSSNGGAPSASVASLSFRLGEGAGERVESVQVTLAQLQVLEAALREASFSLDRA
jgi:hypothetical protein